VGRIGIAVFDENIIYAVLDNQFFRNRNSKQNDEGISRDSFKNMSIQEFNKISDKDLKSFLRSNRFPSKYTAKKIKSDIDNKKISPSDLYKYLVDANSELYSILQLLELKFIEVMMVAKTGLKRTNLF